MILFQDYSLRTAWMEKVRRSFKKNFLATVFIYLFYSQKSIITPSVSYAENKVKRINEVLKLHGKFS